MVDRDVLSRELTEDFTMVQSYSQLAKDMTKDPPMIFFLKELLPSIVEILLCLS